MKRLFAMLALIACSKQSTSSVTLIAPSSSVTTPLPSAASATTRLCGRTDAPRVPADIAALIAEKNSPPYYEFPTMPPAPVEVVERAALEMRNNPKVRAAFENLEMGELREAGAKWTIAAALGNRDISVRMVAVRMLEQMCLEPASTSYMIEVARASAVFVPGSEAATLQGLFMHAIADALNACMGTTFTLRDGQDPEGLKAAADAWQKKACP